MVQFELYLQIKDVFQKNFKISNSDFESQDAIWEKWASLKSRNFDDISMILKPSIQSVFKARAIVCLMHPKISSDLSFTGALGMNEYNPLVQYLDQIHLGEFSPVVHDVVAELLPIFLNTIADAPGARAYNEKYNHFILQILEHANLEKETQKRIFGYYRLENDPSAMEIDQDKMNFKSLYQVLVAPIDASWKYRADQLARKNIQALQANKKLRPMDMSGVKMLWHYARVLQEISKKLEVLPYSQFLFASQISNLYEESVRDTSRMNYPYGFDIPNVFKILEDEPLVKLKFAKFFLQKVAFVIRGPSDYELLEKYLIPALDWNLDEQDLVDFWKSKMFDCKISHDAQIKAESFIKEEDSSLLAMMSSNS